MSSRPISTACSVAARRSDLIRCAASSSSAAESPVFTSMAAPSPISAMRLCPDYFAEKQPEGSSRMQRGYSLRARSRTFRPHPDPCFASFTGRRQGPNLSRTHTKADFATVRRRSQGVAVFGQRPAVWIRSSSDTGDQSGCQYKNKVPSDGVRLPTPAGAKHARQVDRTRRGALPKSRRQGRCRRRLRPIP